MSAAKGLLMTTDVCLEAGIVFKTNKCTGIIRRERIEEISSCPFHRITRKTCRHCKWYLTVGLDRWVELR